MASKFQWNESEIAAKNSMDQLVEISRYYGSDPEFILAGGGNTSVKIGKDLYIKGSGTSLATIDSTGFVKLNRERIHQVLTAQYSDSPLMREEEIKQDLLAARREPERNQRPSVETVLHEMLDSKFVVHTHPRLINIFTCAQKGSDEIKKLFGEDALWVDYYDPGYTLAKAIEKSIADYKSATGKGCPSILFLKNHGLFVSADSVQEIKAITDGIIAKIEKEIDKTTGAGFGGTPSVFSEEARTELIDHLAPALRGILANEGCGPVVVFDDSPEIKDLVCARNGKSIAMGGPLNPDQIVYCKSYPLWLDLDSGITPENAGKKLVESLKQYRSEWSYDPKVILIAGLGLFAIGESPRAAHTVLEVYSGSVQVMSGAMAFGGPRYLSNRERSFIESWEVEQYRRKVAAQGESTGGRVKGKIALVTGSAQGFGKEIAEHLAEEGAFIVLADINKDGVEAVREEINAKYGSRRAFAVEINVTDEESVNSAIHRVVRGLGGLDLVVSNAGVLRAESVKSQSEKDFKFVTSVNYIGYFLCVKHTSKVMSVQHHYNPDYWTDIIQINSKSGLVGSNKNAAYAGSKFGGIGLTQSFAMELVEDGIKVNSICPGNFLNGPLWSDPKRGLFVQYLQAGKVPGAKTIEDVRRYYEAKVPMKRGCTPMDVMRAIYYLVEQAYETGQALPVTGGQVMLS